MEITSKKYTQSHPHCVYFTDLCMQFLNVWLYMSEYLLDVCMCLYICQKNCLFSHNLSQCYLAELYHLSNNDWFWKSMAVIAINLKKKWIINYIIHFSSFFFKHYLLKYLYKSYMSKISIDFLPENMFKCKAKGYLFKSKMI